MIGVEASRARGATFEDVVGIEVKRQATVEQVGGQTAIHAPIRLVDHQQPPLKEILPSAFTSTPSAFCKASEAEPV